jgi:hypothetical protein
MSIKLVLVFVSIYQIMEDWESHGFPSHSSGSGPDFQSPVFPLGGFILVRKKIQQWYHILEKEFSLECSMNDSHHAGRYPLAGRPLLDSAGRNSGMMCDIFSQKWHCYGNGNFPFRLFWALHTAIFM